MPQGNSPITGSVALLLKLAIGHRYSYSYSYSFLPPRALTRQGREPPPQRTARTRTPRNRSTTPAGPICTSCRTARCTRCTCMRADAVVKCRGVQAPQPSTRACARSIPPPPSPTLPAERQVGVWGVSAWKQAGEKKEDKSVLKGGRREIRSPGTGSMGAWPKPPHTRGHPRSCVWCYAAVKHPCKEALPTPHTSRGVFAL